MIYLDHHATTPCSPAVAETVCRYLTRWISPRESETIQAQAAEAVIAGLHAPARRRQRVIWTSGATESLNLAIRGCAERIEEHDHNRVILTTGIEHKAVLMPIAHLVRHRQWRLEQIPTDDAGLVDFSAFERMLSYLAPSMVCVGAVNNEIGTVQDLARLHAACEDRGVVLIVDASQAFGICDLHGDLIALSAHKFYGPRGVGALVMTAGHYPREQILGGGQQGGIRAGTLPLPLIAGMGEAARATETWREAGGADVMRALATDLYTRVCAGVEERTAVWLNGPHDARHPGNISLTIAGIDAADLRASMPQVVCSQGAVCSNGQASHVLHTIGLLPVHAAGTLRFGVGRDTTSREVREASALVVRQVCALLDAVRVS